MEVRRDIACGGGWCAEGSGSSDRAADDASGEYGVFWASCA